ncbi:hypothetical protein SKAU_G00016720 [Synaphobranchus kaupii]|uniref:F-box domain-containing protein n=1 Tax=Synaphobranchus kaupii TaxID=118154 RepID=A0A9Q1JE19_SYNKA|nr:hypothetical protein SKAU_G00016720 [Synaphobranchus kaupii]
MISALRACRHSNAWIGLDAHHTLKMGSEAERTFHTTPKDQPGTPHLDTLRSKRLQFFSKNQSNQNSTLASKSTAPHANGPIDRPVSLFEGEAELDPLLLQDSGVPEHQKLRHVLAWAQNFIRTGPVIPPAVGQGRVSPINADHMTLTKSKELPTRQVLQSSQINFSPQSCPLSQPCPEPHPLPRPLPQPCPEPHPLLCPLAQPCHEPHILPGPLTQSCSEPQFRPLTQPCPEPHPHSLFLTRPQPQPGLSVYETYLMCVAHLSRKETEGCKESQGCNEVQLSCRETQGCKEAQLSCREAQGCKKALVRGRAGRLQSQCVDTSENRCMNVTGVVGDLKSSNFDRGEGRRALAACAHLPVSIVEEILPNAAAPVITPADHTAADLHANRPADHTTAELLANTPADHVTAELPVNTLADHTTAELHTNTPDHATAELPPSAPAEGPVRETRSGVQDRCHKGSDEGRRRNVEKKRPAGSWPRRAVSSGSFCRRRFWEKSSMLWSSYPDGALLPRMKPSHRPAFTSSSVADSTTQNSALSPDSSPLKDSVGHETPQHHVPGGTVFKLWLSLPDELWMAILKLMSHSDLSHVAQTCHRLCRLANDRILWQVVRIENSTCLDADLLSSIGRRGPCSLTLYRCTDEHVTPCGLEQLFAQSGDSLRELRIVSCIGPGLHGDRLLVPCSRYCAHLTNVDVSWTGATDTGIAALASATSSLESVVVNGCRITDRVFKFVIKRHGRSLRRLEVFGCRSLSTVCLSVMATGCPDLKVLNLGKLPKITEACLNFITGCLKQLTSLDLTGLAVVRDKTVHMISRQCPELQDLTLRCCPSITDCSLIEISTYSASIRYLDVSGCSAVTDLGIHAISMACQRLQYLDLSSTKTSNKGVHLLASYGSRHLHTVKISFCYICQDSLRKLCRYCRGLRLLHLYGACDFHNIQELRLINPSLEAKCDLTCVTPAGQLH